MYGLIVHSTKGDSCMRDVCVLLSNVKAPMTMAELRNGSNQKWEWCEISSVLSKLLARGDIQKFPPDDFHDVHRYLWIATV